MTMTQKELAELVGLTDRQLRNINKEIVKDEPEDTLFVKAEGESKYELKAFVQRWCKYQVRKVTEGISDLDAVKARHEIVKTEKTELEVAKMRGELLDFRDVKKAWADVAHSVTQAFMNLPTTLAPMVRGIDSAEVIVTMIDSEIRRTLEGIAETPLPTYAADISSSAENEEE